jgi:hypothetical protein
MATTKRVRLGTSVVVLPLRHPLPLAKELATLQNLSGGRLIPASARADRYQSLFCAPPPANPARIPVNASVGRYHIDNRIQTAAATHANWVFIPS